MRFLEEIKKWLGEITEIALLLVALGIVFEILFGPGFFGSGSPGVVANVTVLVKSLGMGENGFVGLIAFAIILWLFYRKKAASYQQN